MTQDRDNKVQIEGLPGVVKVANAGHDVTSASLISCLFITLNILWVWILKIAVYLRHTATAPLPPAFFMHHGRVMFTKMQTNANCPYIHVKWHGGESPSVKTVTKAINFPQHRKWWVVPHISTCNTTTVEVGLDIGSKGSVKPEHEEKKNDKIKNKENRHTWRTATLRIKEERCVGREMETAKFKSQDHFFIYNWLGYSRCPAVMTTY